MAGFGRLDWDDWLYGLFAALIGGGASSVSSGFASLVVDPQDFNVAHPGKLLATMMVTFLISGMISGFAFLRQRPLPAIKTVTTSTETIEQHGVPTVVSTKVAETRIETVTPETQP